MRTRSADAPHPEITLFLQLASPDQAVFDQARRQLQPVWRDGYAMLVLDMVRLMRGASTTNATSAFEVGPEADTGDADGQGGLDRGDAPARRYDPGSPVRRRMLEFLEQQTGKKFGDDLDAWRYWMWSLDYAPHPDAAWFKGGVYSNIDSRMRDFFPRGVRSEIRLDQVDWGGVRVNGIPPLVDPAVVDANSAKWLKGKHIVFGVEVAGEARAYPRRILAWHEMARDALGGVDLAIVYCTLCGTVIPYESRIGKDAFTFGTSGFLYKSNKLMFDEETMSLWSTVYGRPVIGPLAGSGLQLASRPVVTTTWGEWKAMHPDTTVLSIETGYGRDYDEGAAYASYLRSDALMFAVDVTDDRLANKAEVLVLPYTATLSENTDARPLAIAVKFLATHRVFHTERAGKRIVVLTSRRGANRVYDSAGQRFAGFVDDDHVKDEADGVWRITEDALIPADPNLAPRPRIAAHRSFWFGWFAQHPETELIR